jgi:FkbM family methyltransferase
VLPYFRFSEVDVRKLAKRIIDAAAGAMGGRFHTRDGYRFGINWIDDLRHFPEGRNLRVAFDIGANRGQTALSLANAFPDASIHSFEPVAVTFKELEKTAAQLPRVRAHRLALADAPGELTMSADADGQNRLVDRAFTGAVERVPVSTVDQFCAEHGIDRIDLLKIDVEGAELRVLKGASESFEKRSIPMLLSECDFFQRKYEPHTHFTDLIAFLEPLGYRVVSFYTGGVDAIGWRWGDVLLRRAANDLPDDVYVTPLLQRR